MKALPELTLAKKGAIDKVLAAGGLAARCTARADGACEVQVYRGKKLVARGKTLAGFAETSGFKVRLTGAGRRLLQQTTGTVRLKAVASVPGVPDRVIRLVLR